MCVGVQSTVEELFALDGLVELLLAHALVRQAPGVDGVAHSVQVPIGVLLLCQHLAGVIVRYNRILNVTTIV